MFWNKKKKRNLPDLPTPQVISPKIQKKEEISSLPSFPDAPSKKGFSQEVIKGAIEPIDKSLPIPRKKPIKMTKEILESEGIPKLPEEKGMLPSLNSNFENKSENKLREIDEWTPSKEPPKKTFEKKPIFIKLDKFNEAKESLEFMKEKLSEIDELLKSIKDVKSKEEKEISEWEKEMENLKSKLESLTTNVFEDIEV
tara:strand:- start:551 stop:1144 length:594 start_codon:yes stop_codon:yes gene_type:complete